MRDGEVGLDQTERDFQMVFSELEILGPGKTIRIGIEIPKMDRSAMGAPQRGGMSGGKTSGRMPGGGTGGRGGMGGGMSGGMGGRGGMGNRQSSDMFKSLKVWITVPLAKKN